MSPDVAPEGTPELTQPDDLLLAEGDRLARRLAQVLPMTLHDSVRISLLGRSLAVNLVQALRPTLEQISRRTGKPLHTLLDTDERGRAVLLTVNLDGETVQRLAVDDLLQELLFMRGRLHPAVLAELQDAMSGDEHHATRALVRCLRLRPVLAGLQRVLGQLLT